MQWIQSFTNSQIPFYTYPLNAKDYITYTIKANNNRCIIILYGVIYIVKVFSNQEIVVLGILQKHDIIKEPENNLHEHYAIVAMQKSFLISFAWKDIIKHKYMQLSLMTNILQSHYQTLYQYEKMNCILSHKSTKHRVIQLLLSLFVEFGIINSHYTMIPFHISQNTISIIIGSNKSIVNKIINELCKIHAIGYVYNRYICIHDPFILSYCYNNQ